MSRAPRTPMLTRSQAQAAEISAVMRDWPQQMEDRLRSTGLDGFAGGDQLWQAKLESELANPEHAAAIVWLAENGHVSARRALTKLLEDGRAELPASVRAYCVRLNEGMIPAHPKDRSEVIKNMLRDVGIGVMVDVAAEIWSLPKLYSSTRRHSAAFFVALTMTAYGIALTERQVRRIYSDRPKLSSRLARFLLAAEQTI